MDSAPSVFTVLAYNLREQRKQKLLSQEQLADLAGLDRTYISLIETGKRNPSLSTIVDLAAILQIEVIDLLLEKTTTLTPIEQFCAEYAINPKALPEILRDPKVIPMIRGKAFEFAVQDRLVRLLKVGYTSLTPFLNPQSGTDKTDVQITRAADGVVFRVECKLTQKGGFKALPKQQGYQLRVKCMRSRTLGEKAAERMSVKTGRTAHDHFIHSDQYLPNEFDFVVTSIANAFFETDDDGVFIWQPPEQANPLLAVLGIENANAAFGKMYVAKSTALCAIPANAILCSRQTCTEKTTCGFIPNYPTLVFNKAGQIQHPWYPLEQLESLLNS